MHPVGLALAFLVFWSLAAVGAFLVLHGGRGLKGGTRNAFWAIVNGTTALLGATMMSAGIYATFVVLYAR